jgi:hypothetical protein
MVKNLSLTTLGCGVVSGMAGASELKTAKILAVKSANINVCVNMI